MIIDEDTKKLNNFQEQINEIANGKMTNFSSNDVSHTAVANGNGYIRNFNNKKLVCL